MIVLDLEPALLDLFRSAGVPTDAAARLGRMRARLVKQLGPRLHSAPERSMGSRTTSRNGAELCRALSAGDSSAFAELFEKYAPRLTSFAARSLGPADADEVTQQAFIALMDHAKDSRDPYDLESFLFALLRTRILRVLSNRARMRDVALDAPILDSELAIEREQDPALGVLAAEERDRLIAALLDLDELEREVVVARLTGVDYAEIARRLELEIGNARVILHRAVKKLRSKLEARR